MALIRISRRLARDASNCTFGKPVAFVYNPLEYARIPHEAYLSRYGAGLKEVLLVGMNPGPFGMAQTGVPFGDVSMVRDWLEIGGRVNRPEREHAKRPISGFDCPRSEVSGTRLWGWARDRFRSPEAFFARFFVWNYCPLCFMNDSGANVTPDKLPAGESRPLFEVCDAALVSLVRELKPSYIVGVGSFAEDRIREALGSDGPTIGRILHPSPASPSANRDWAGQATSMLRTLGVEL